MAVDTRRDFGDPALANFEKLSQFQGPPQTRPAPSSAQQKQKKPGFFGSLFKKNKDHGPPANKQKPSKQRPKSSFVQGMHFQQEATEMPHNLHRALFRLAVRSPPS